MFFYTVYEERVTFKGLLVGLTSN